MLFGQQNNLKNNLSLVKAASGAALRDVQYMYPKANETNLLTRQYNFIQPKQSLDI